MERKEDRGKLVIYMFKMFSRMQDESMQRPRDSQGNLQKQQSNLSTCVHVLTCCMFIQTIQRKDSLLETDYNLFLDLLELRIQCILKEKLCLHLENGCSVDTVEQHPFPPCIWK